jgi:hypothetical protein
MKSILTFFAGAVAAFVLLLWQAIIPLELERERLEDACPINPADYPMQSPVAP